MTTVNHLRFPINDATLADLDGDNDLDVITASAKVFGYHLNNHGRFRPLRVIARSPGGHGHAVAVGDADGDGDKDVYAMMGEENPNDRILLNDHLQFTGIPVPPATRNADDVITLHPWSGTPQVGFLALNGRRESQPGWSRAAHPADSSSVKVRGCQPISAEPRGPASCFWFPGSQCPRHVVRRDADVPSREGTRPP